MIRIWSDVRFGSVDAAIDAAIARAFAGPPRFYLIPRPDIPWQPDRLRENPTSRGALHRLHMDLLGALGADHLELVGTQEERLDAALTEVARRLPVNHRAP